MIRNANDLIGRLHHIRRLASQTNPSRRLLAAEFQQLAEELAGDAGSRVASLNVEADRFTMPRPSYLPEEVRGQEPFVPEGTDLAIWTWEKYTPRGGSVPYGIAFQGKSNKPLWHYSFRSESERQRRIDETIEARKAALGFKQKRLEERQNYQHDFKVGDILYSSWGYDQTNINFYEVVDAGIKEVIVREIASKVVGSTQYDDKVVAAPGKYIGPPLRRRPAVGGRIKINDVQRAYKWEGRPLSETNLNYGH